MQIQLLSNDRYPPLAHHVSNAEPGSWSRLANAAPGCHAIRITLGRNVIVILVTSHPVRASLSDPCRCSEGALSDTRAESNADRTFHVRIASAALSSHLTIAHPR